MEATRMGLRLCGRTLCALSVAFLAGWVATPAHAGDNDGAGFLIISVSESFDVPDVHLHCQSSDDGGCHDNRCGCKKRKRNDKKNCECVLPTGSQIVVVPIGWFRAGYDVRNTWFESAGVVTSDQLADVIAGLTGGIEDLNGHTATIFGSVDTTGPNSIHLFTPDPGTVPPDVQEAIFNASPFLEALDPLDPMYPQTTVDLGDFIWLNQAPAMATLQDIMDYLYAGGCTMECTTCEAEAELYPHDPELGNKLMDFSFSFDEDGNVHAEGCTTVAIDVKPGNGDGADPINPGSEGVTPLVIYSSGAYRDDGNGGTEWVTFFDPADVDPDTVLLLAAKTHGVSGQNWVGATPVKSSLSDLNGDGVADLVLHFDTQDLVDADLGGIIASTTAVELHGETYDKGCLKGTDTVYLVPPGS